jgi:small subunit ribosomal protein S12
MSTLNQVLKKRIRKKKKHKTRTSYLEKRPHGKGICTKISIRKPKKPNSAQRKVVRVMITRKKDMYSRKERHVTCYIPGQGHNSQKYSVVLFRGGRVKDLPGIKYKIIRGKYDFSSDETCIRKKGLSKYGKKKL